MAITPDPRHPAPPDGPPAEVKIQFIKELGLFMAGLLLGFFWYLYYDTNPTPEIHMIIGLIVVIMALLRYIMLTRRL